MIQAQRDKVDEVFTRDCTTLIADRAERDRYPACDQFEQSEKRWVFGGQIARTWEDKDIFGIKSDLTLGFQTRHDLINGIGLYDTVNRKRYATTRQDDIWEGSAGLYGQWVSHWTPWFRTDRPEGCILPL